MYACPSHRQEHCDSTAHMVLHPCMHAHRTGKSTDRGIPQLHMALPPCMRSPVHRQGCCDSPARALSKVHSTHGHRLSVHACIVTQACNSIYRVKALSQEKGSGVGMYEVPGAGAPKTFNGLLCSPSSGISRGSELPFVPLSLVYRFRIAVRNRAINYSHLLRRFVDRHS